MGHYSPRGKNSFRLVVELGRKEKGKKNRKTKTIRIEDKALLKSKRKLEKYLETELLKFEMEVKSGAYIDPSKMIFSDFVEEWEKKYAVKELSETTLENHLSHIKNHILPVIGSKRIDQIKTLHLIDLIDGMKRKDGDEKPLSSSTKHDTYRTLKTIFERAVEWKLIKENPVVGVPKPKVKSTRKINVYDEDETKDLMVAAQNELPHWRMFITLALTAGLRRSELLGLEWKDINIDDGTLDIRQVIVRGKSGALIKEPKTEKSFRLVALPSTVLNELKLYKAHWNKERLKMGEHWIERNREWFFCNQDGTHFYPTTPTTWWNRFVKRAKVRHIRLHDMRHTNATLLIAQGVHAKIIAERLGHSNIKVTMDTYGHLMRRADTEAANKLDSIFRKNNG
ncbi:tyrosine-type recombinase/integrase [Evansella clarkii]|uniref:tyrosine-type recombinase/integrase n=1 Tax=Evansella clarkii TaxID=79879 RepID=UPI000B442D35|nr:site-specific integrase [Evansella clarkii]